MFMSKNTNVEGEYIIKFELDFLSYYIVHSSFYLFISRISSIFYVLANHGVNISLSLSRLWSQRKFMMSIFYCQLHYNKSPMQTWCLHIYEHSPLQTIPRPTEQTVNHIWIPHI